MCMDDNDLQILDRMIGEYHVNDVLRALLDSINKRQDELVDAELKDEAKPLTLAAHHLAIFIGD